MIKINLISRSLSPEICTNPMALMNLAIHDIYLVIEF